MKPHASSRRFTLGRSLSDPELADFAGGVTEGGCIPNPVKEAVEKRNGVQTSTIYQIAQ